MDEKINIKFLYYPVFTAFAVFVVLPLVYMLYIAVFGSNFLQNLSMIDSDSLALLGKSIFIAATTGILATFIGGTASYFLNFTQVKGSSFFKLILLLPLFVSPYIFAVAWQDFFFMLTEKSNFISSSAGLIFILTFVYSPLSMLVIGSAFANIDTKLTEAALLMTDYKHSVRHIVLPLIKPAIIASFVLVFIFSISEFSVPAYLGINVFTTEIFLQFSAFYNHSLALLQSLMLIIICILLLSAERKYIADAPFFSLGTKGNKRVGMHSNSLSGLFFLSLLFIISSLIPIIILAVKSFDSGMTSFLEALQILKPAIFNSIILSFAGGVVILFTGFIAALKIVGKKTKIHKIFDWLLLITFATPSLILGISFIKFYNRPELNFIYSGMFIILIAYAGKFSFISAKLIENALGQIPASLFDAASVSGIGTYKNITKIMLPLITPSLFAAFIIGFIFSFGELATTIMLYPPGTEILPIKVFTLSANATQSFVNSMSLIVFSVMLLLVALFYFLMKLITMKQTQND